MPVDRSGVVITGIGARTAVGDNALQVAASIRAGVNRLREWRSYDGREGTLVAAFTDPDLQEGPWTEKALDLLSGPVAEALCTAGLCETTPLAESAKAGRLRLYLASPSPTRPGAAPQALSRVLMPLTHLLVPGRVSVKPEIVGLDQVAGVLALAKACEALQEDRADIALVCGVDSLLDLYTLAPLIQVGRVKTRSVSSGLIPGEAGACAVLEMASLARRRKAPVLARVQAVALEHEEGPTGPEAPVTARALGRALESVCRQAGGAKDFSRILCDLNGERWRFLEWSLAETRFSDQLRRGWRLWHPADVVGDVGAAFAPLAMIIAARAFARRYAGGGKVLVLASNDSGERGALALAPPQGE